MSERRLRSMYLSTFHKAFTVLLIISLASFFCFFFSVSHDYTVLNASCLRPPDFPSFMEEYSTWHHQQLMYNASNAHYLVYTCNTGCAGTGDRFRCLLPLLYAAIATKRVFLIDYTNPTPLTDVFVPNRINWNASLNQVPGYFTQPTTDLVIGRSMPQTHPGWYYDMDSVANGSGPQVLKVRANFPPRYPYVRGFQDITGYTMIPQKFHHLAWDYLFTPTEDLRKRVVQLLKESGVYGNNYTAVHMRMGSVGGDIKWDDPVRHKLSHVELFYDLAKQMQKPGEHVIVISDSDVAKEAIVALDSTFMALNTSLIHVDKSSKGETETSKIAGHVDTFAEILILGGSRCFVGSRSRFSYLARKMSSPLDGSPRCSVTFDGLDKP